MATSPAPPDDLLEALTAAAHGEAAALALVRGFLDGAAAPGSLPQPLADALVDGLSAARSADKLNELAAGAGKALAKQARRALHLLRARGVTAAVPVATGRPIAALRSVAEPEPPSLCSVSVSDGERVVWYVRQDPGEGLSVHKARFNETEGLLEFDHGLPSRRGWREAEQQIMGDAVLHMTRVPSPWVRWLIEEAAERAALAGRTAPRSFAEARHTLPAPIAFELPALASDAEIAAVTEEQLEEIDRIPELTTWIPDEATARKAADEIVALGESKLVLDDGQRRQQGRAVVERVRDEALAGPWRARLARRLRDTAYLISRRPARGSHGPKAGRDRDHRRDVLLCLAAARQTEQAAVPTVARLLFDRLLRNQTALSPTPAHAPPARESGLLVTP